MKMLLAILLISSTARAGVEVLWPGSYQKANTYFAQKQYDSAYVHYFKLAYQSNNDLPDSIIAESFRKLGIIYFMQEQYEKSLANFKQAGELYARLDDGVNEEKCRSNQANVYVKQKKFKLAEKLYQQSLKVAAKNKDETALLMNEINLGYLYDYSGQYDLAANHLLKALDLAVKIEDSLRLNMSLNNLSMLYLNRNMPDSAFHYLHRSILLSNDLRLKKAALKNIYEIYLQLGNSDSASMYLNRYQIVSDSLKNEKIALIIAGLESELQLEKAKSKFSFALNWIIGLGALLLAGSIFWFMEKRLTSQQLKQSENLTRLFIKQLKAFENQKQEVGSALHSNVLPTLTSVRNLLDLGQVEKVKQPLREAIKILYELHNTQFYTLRFGNKDWLTYAPTNAKNNSEWIVITYDHDPKIYSNEFQIVVLAILEHLLQDGQQQLSIIPDEYGIEVAYSKPIHFSENTTALLSFFGCTVQEHILHIPLFENR